MYDERKKCGDSNLALPKSHQSYVLMNSPDWREFDGIYFLQLSRR